MNGVLDRPMNGSLTGPMYGVMIHITLGKVIPIYKQQRWSHQWLQRCCLIG